MFYGITYLIGFNVIIENGEVTPALCFPCTWGLLRTGGASSTIFGSPL